jgi:hypothetical protein
LGPIEEEKAGRSRESERVSEHYLEEFMDEIPAIGRWMKRSHGGREICCGEWNYDDLVSMKNLFTDLGDRCAHKENNVRIRIPERGREGQERVRGRESEKEGERETNRDRAGGKYFRRDPQKTTRFFGSVFCAIPMTISVVAALAI